MTERGIDGDAWRFPFHGGRRQAILLITIEGIEELIAQGFPLFAGALGENLTTRGLDRRALRFGQRLRAGGTEIELTRMRTPCATLNVYGSGIQAAMFDAAVQAGDPGVAAVGLERLLRVGRSARHGAPRRRDHARLSEPAVTGPDRAGSRPCRAP